MKHNNYSFFFILFLFSYYMFSQVIVTPVLGTQKYAVIPFDYLQDGLEVSVSDIEYGMFTSSNSIKAFYEEASYGKMTLEGVVYPYRTTQPALYGAPGDYTNCYPDDTVISNQTDVDYSNIDGLITFVHDTNDGKSCGFGNSSSSKLNFTTSDGPQQFTRSNFRVGFEFPYGFHRTTNATVAHELLHSYGNGFHSNAYIKSGGEWVEQGYGNLYDMLGLRQYASHPCSMLKHKLGWLTDNEIEYTTQTATYRIYPLEKTLPGQTQCVIIELPNLMDLEPNNINPHPVFDRLYLEYRGLTGFDARTSTFRRVRLSDGSYYSFDNHGLSIVGVNCVTLPDCRPILIDMHPEPIGGIGAGYAPHEIADAPLTIAEIYNVPNNNIQIEVLDVSPENYIDIRVTMPSTTPNTLYVMRNGTAIDQFNLETEIDSIIFYAPN